MFNIKLLDEAESVGLEDGFCSDLLIPLQISLCEVSVPISEILKMEQSDEIFVNLEEKTLVTLLLGGEPVATAEMDIIGEKIELKIKNVFLDQGQENSDNLEVELENDQQL